MCAGPTYADFVAAHHELAHVQYYMHYASQPSIFREGANPCKLKLGLKINSYAYIANSMPSVP
jgi:hypothetical protein